MWATGRRTWSPTSSPTTSSTPSPSTGAGSTKGEIIMVLSTLYYCKYLIHSHVRSDCKSFEPFVRSSFHIPVWMFWKLKVVRCFSQKILTKPWILCTDPVLVKLFHGNRWTTLVSTYPVHIFEKRDILLVIFVTKFPNNFCIPRDFELCCPDTLSASLYSYCFETSLTTSPMHLQFMSLKCFLKFCLLLNMYFSS